MELGASFTESLPTDAGPAADVVKPVQSAHAAIIISLEKEKLRLADQITRDALTARDLEAQVAQLEIDILAKRTKLSNYNALFIRMPDADIKAAKQRLGAREAVLGTKRIIQKELAKLENEVIVAEMKLNKSKEKNQAIREKINTLRREQVTYRKLFDKMQEELADVKIKLRDTDVAIADGYRVRDRAQEEMREVVKQFEFDKRNKVADFRAVSDALDALPSTSLHSPTASTTLPGHKSAASRGASAASHGAGSPSAAAGAGGEQDAAKKRLVKMQEKITRDKYATELAHRKMAAFTSALDQIKAATGYNRVQEVVDIFNRYEEEKFTKAQLAQRLLDDIERLEARVASMHDEVRTREEANTTLKQSRARTIDALERSVAEREKEAQEVDAAVQRAVSDVKSLYRAIEFAFNALGLRQAMGERPAIESLAGAGGLGSPMGSPMAIGPDGRPMSPFPQLPGAEGFANRTGTPLALTAGGSSPRGFGLGGPGAGSSQLLSPTGDMRRSRSTSSFAADARTRHAVRSGISASTLATFVGSIESRGAEIIQQYVAFVTRVSSGLTGMHSLAAGPGEAGADGDKDAASAAAFIQTKRKFAALAGELTDRAMGGALSPALLGPANPPGGVRESIATSSIMAALAVDSTKATVEEMGGAEDEHRPLSLRELKDQAVSKFSSDKNLRALKVAANAAASVLISSPIAAGMPLQAGDASGRQVGASFAGATRT